MRDTVMNGIERVADEVLDEIRRVTPIDTGGFRRKHETGSLGVPVWLHELLEQAGWDGHILAVEIGGRGVLHPDAGWVSIDELQEVAHD